MTVYMIHVPCGKPIAKFIGREEVDDNYRIKSRDFVLMSGKRPRPFGSILCTHCKRAVQTHELIMGDDDAINDLATRSH